MFLQNNRLEGGIPDVEEVKAINMGKFFESTFQWHLMIVKENTQTQILLKPCIERLKIHKNLLEGEVPDSICALVDNKTLTTLDTDCAPFESGGFLKAPQIICQKSCCKKCFVGKLLSENEDPWSSWWFWEERNKIFKRRDMKRKV